jgi:predicted ArsR family transcriptional regulator
VQLLGRLFRHLDKVDAEGDASRGRELLERVFGGIAAEVAADHRTEVRGASLDERVAAMSRALEREGIVDGWHKEGEIYHIVNGECPYLRLAEMSDLACRSDQKTVELLVGRPVEQIRRIVDGAPVCEYIIRPEPVRVEEEIQGSRNEH